MERAKNEAHARSEKKIAKIKSFYEVNDGAEERFAGCFARYRPESIKNEYCTDLLTWLKDGIQAEGTRVHSIQNDIDTASE